MKKFIYAVTVLLSVSLVNSTSQASVGKTIACKGRTGFVGLAAVGIDNFADQLVLKIVSRVDVGTTTTYTMDVKTKLIGKSEAGVVLPVRFKGELDNGKISLSLADSSDEVDLSVYSKAKVFAEDFIGYLDKSNIRDAAINITIADPDTDGSDLQTVSLFKDCRFKK